jgi:prepilin-type N-terminal cleavage/methylation domain-containing protein
MPTRQVSSKKIIHQSRAACATCRGFSLIELLAVIGMIALLAVLVAPSIQQVGGSNRIGRAVSELTALLELARTEALARSTYVWVAFANRTNPAGNAELCAVAFASRDGTAIASGALVEPITKMLKLEGVQLTSKDQLSSAVQNLYETATTAAVSTATAPKNLPPLQNITFDRTLTLAPDGKAMLDAVPTSSTGFENLIDISLRPMRGTAVDSTSNDHVSIWLSGGSGRIQNYRLQ